jgi:hypothetical protein
VSKFDSISMQPQRSLCPKFARSCFATRVFRLRQRRSLTSAQGCALATLGAELIFPGRNSERVESLLAGNRRNSFRVGNEGGRILSQGFKAIPGLKLANAVGVKAGPSVITTGGEET